MRRRRHSDFHRVNETRRLALDPINKKLGGVCAGIANHFGWSSFTVRILALVALFTMPHFAIPAYGLAYLILDNETELERELYDL